MFYDFRKLGVDVRVVGVLLLNTLQDQRQSAEYRGIVQSTEYTVQSIQCRVESTGIEDKEKCQSMLSLQFIVYTLHY